MEIRVEIGNPEQRRLIARELSSLEGICNEFDPPLELAEIVVPSDFDKVVNKLQRTNSYKSSRSTHMAVAKILPMNGQYCLVISPALFTAAHDSQSRAFFYFHEIAHLYSNRSFAQQIDSTEIPAPHSTNMSILFDEYFADRKSFETIDALFSEKTPNYLKLINDILDGHLYTLTHDSDFHDSIKREIASFRSHGDINRFLQPVGQIFDEVSKAMIHAYACLDHFPSFAERRAELHSSKFINERTLALVDFIRSRYIQSSTDLMDGIPLIAGFLANFGMKFEFLPSGYLWCHVLDI